MPVAALAGGPDKRFDLSWRQVLTRAQFGVAGPPGRRLGLPNNIASSAL
jgi:hypothetical protein